jgi:HK97 family phage prohead protease
MKDLETKDLKFSLDGIDEEKGIFRGYASIYGVIDSYGDVVDKGAFRRTIKDNTQFPLLWSHDVQKPIGIVIPKEDHTGLKVEGHLNLDVQLGRETRSLMKQGAVSGLSIGYQVVKSEPDEVEKAPVRRLKEIKLWEISPVVFQACPGAVVADVKSDEPDEAKPFPNNHACVIDDSLKVVGSQTREHNGKKYTVRIGKKPGGGSGDHSYLYPKDTWTEAEARAHCKDHDGTFEAATGKCIECNDTPDAEPEKSAPSEDISNSDAVRLLEQLKFNHKR